MSGSHHQPAAPLHIGIVACSAPGAALCYRTICAEGAASFGPHAHPPVSLHGESFAAYVERLGRADLRGVGELMLRSAGRLAASGADFLVCPDNTIHAALPGIERESPRPWLHIADAVADEAIARGFRRLGIAGTRWLVESDVYPDRLAARGLEWVRPGEAAREALHRLIMDDLVRDEIPPHAGAVLGSAMEELRGAGCDAVVLACTELPLVRDAARAALPELPTLDSTRLLARAALRRAARGRAAEAGDGGGRVAGGGGSSPGRRP